MMHDPELNIGQNEFNTNEQQLLFAAQAAGIGTWYFYTENLTDIFLDDLACKLLGLKNYGKMPIKAAFEYIHIDDQTALNLAIEKIFRAKTTTHFDFSFRVLKNFDDSYNWVRFLGKFYGNETDSAYRFTGIAIDAQPQKKLREEIEDRQIEIKAQLLAHKEVMASEARFRTIVEQAPVAIAMLNGKNLVVETANDAILKLWGKNRSVMGLDLADALPELKGQHFLELLENVYTTGQPFFGYSTLAKLMRNGVLEDAYFDFVYTPMRNADEKITGVIVLATEVTAQVTAHIAVEESERRFRNIVEQAPVATCLFVGRDLVIDVANQLMIDIWGKGQTVIGQPLKMAVPELEDQPFLKILDDIFNTGEAYSAKDAACDIVVNGIKQTFYFDFTYKPLFNATGEVYGIIDMAVDVTQQVVARKQLEESELFAKSIIHNSPVAKLVVTGDDMIIKTANEHMLEMIGNNPSIIGMPFSTALPQLTNTPMFARLKHVMTTGQTYYQPEEKHEFIRYGKPYTGYYNVIYKALPSIAGGFYGIIVTAVEITDQVNVRNALEVSESRLRSLVESAPFPIGVYTGKEMVILLANQSILDVFGKGNDVIGKKYMDILPELENQAVFEELAEVFDTGVAIHRRNQQINIVTNGITTTYYFNYSLTPLFDATGKVYGIMNTAADVTDLFSAKQLVEQTEASLRGAVELAELGTWSYNFTTKSVHFSDRMRDWFGFENEQFTAADALNLVNQNDRDLISSSMKLVTQLSNYQYDVEFTCANRLTHRERIIHAQGKVFFNEKGEKQKVVGTAQDVTKQRQLQLALEQEVRLRTEELAAINEKLKTANEELEITNTRLLHSNEELAQYAYVASHDLQEPLRKIRMFSSMLAGKDEMPQMNKDLIEKIRSSSERMSLLIQDLLEFSRLLKSENLMRPVDLSAIMVAVINDFELTIKEKKATIDVGKLPVIEAVNLQMNQLFYNLLSNALKFTTPEKQPQISVQSTTLSQQEASEYIPNILPFSQYHHLTFTDNGIGFEVQYAEQIFEVFKRLHGRDIYPGSGIGLALCRRIVGNHNGVLFVESKLNEGTTFHIIMPDKQHAPQTTLPENFSWNNN